jgi:hypothetical protein
MMLFGVIGLPGLSPDRTASLPGGLSRRQIRTTKSWPDRRWMLIALFSLMVACDEPTAFVLREAHDPFFGRLPSTSSPGVLSYDRERLSWRCVGRRREEPAARRRATDGQFC